MPLNKNADAGDYVKDFQNSDAPQFKGKSKEKRRKMAIAAYLDSKDKKESTMQEATYKVEIDGGIETVTARTEKEAIRKAARKQGNSKSVGKTFGPKVKVTKIKEGTQMKTFQSIREAANAAQQAAIAIAKKEKGEKPKNESKKDFIYAAKMAKDKGEKTFMFAGKRYNCEDAFSKGAVERGKVKVGASKGRMDALKKDHEAKKKAQNDAISKLRGDKTEGKKMDSAAMAKAMAAFKKKGGKITKVAPGKAAGYHGKDDPGKGMHGMMDKGDTKGLPRKKKIRSMR